MRDDTPAHRIAIRALGPFRRFSERTGEGGAALMMGLPFVSAFSLLSPDPARIPANMVCLAVLALVALAVFARHQDSEGHRAMRRLDPPRKKDASATPDPKYLEGLRWLALPDTASVADIKAAVRARMMRHHADTGSGDLDMDRLVKFRDTMVAYAAAVAPDGQDAHDPTPQALLTAYARAAGRLGRAWGHMFPTRRLRSLGYR
jgi:hypothetical protein